MIIKPPAKIKNPQHKNHRCPKIIKKRPGFNEPILSFFYYLINYKYCKDQVEYIPI